MLCLWMWWKGCLVVFFGQPIWLQNFFLIVGWSWAAIPDSRQAKTMTDDTIHSYPAARFIIADKLWCAVEQQRKAVSGHGEPMPKKGRPSRHFPFNCSSQWWHELINWLDDINNNYSKLTNDLKRFRPIQKNQTMFFHGQLTGGVHNNLSMTVSERSVSALRTFNQLSLLSSVFVCGVTPGMTHR